MYFHTSCSCLYLSFHLFLSYLLNSFTCLLTFLDWMVDASDSRCVVLWSDSLCDACWCLPLWGPWWPQEFQKDHWGNNLRTFQLSIIRSQLLVSYALCIFCSQRIMSIQYKIPEYVHVSQDCRQLLSRIFVANPAKVLLYLNSDQLTRPIHDFF